ncbi:hypothetical protein LTR70_009408 [Exophiala xenobiotica]|uniref:Uso1/p115-like vesicle tethering protein C-terminal domain-containing protein n=1 Tax=Lithohypha guttulata TaxID=1690604 RepID=A0ABR0JXC5_9EURO|nr:hypothetical protein LTR24_009313 [Lithohypha guttulata]KAK5310545.1 hypothetical protein LTR70_009408 [Exophiala xenobiotica]
MGFQVMFCVDQASKTETSLKTGQLDLDKLTAENKSLLGQVSQAQQDLQQSKNANKTVRKELEGAIEELKVSNHAVSSAANSSNKELEVSEEELEQLRTAAVKQKDTQTEFDDMLVVLKDLGEDVSEDEDEGEDNREDNGESEEQEEEESS